jgi:uncharacterized Fe-S cluster protein YjdI
MKKIIKKYPNSEITVIWKPHMCIHSGICFRGLPEVFDPKVRPWIRAEGASTEQIIKQLKQCPSGAISFQLKEEG